MKSRIGFWLQVLEQGAASLNSAAGWFGSVVLVLGLVAGVVVPVVAHVSHWLTAVIILGVVMVGVLEGSYRVWAVTEAERHAALQVPRPRPSPASQQHRDDLRHVVFLVRRSLEAGAAPYYDQRDPDMWRAALFEHFPALIPALEAVLEKAEQKDAAFDLLKNRMRTEAAAAGIGAPTWTSEESVLPWRAEGLVRALVTTIQARPATRSQEPEFNFDWRQVGNTRWCVGVPPGVPLRDRVHLDCDPGDFPALKEKFEAFLRQADSWPEAAASCHASEQYAAARAAAIEQLAVAANTDPITSSCFLCGGSSKPAAALN